MKFKKLFLIATICICQIILFSCGKKTEVVETTKETTTTAPTTTAAKVYDFTKIEKTEADKFSGFLSVTFGKYQGEDIEWLIIDKNDDTALLLSKKILDCKNYNEVKEDVTWEKSSLRKWLNNDFLNAAFKDEQLMKFGNMSSYGFALINGDRVSLLNTLMCEKYFGNEDANKQNKKLVAKATPYAKSMGVECDDHIETDFYDCGSFFLTDNGDSLSKAAWVGQYGHVYTEGQPVKLEKGDGVRPIICLKTEAFSNGVIDSINANLFHITATETEDNKKKESAEDNEIIDSESSTQENKTYIYSNVSKYTLQSANVPCSEKNVVDLKSWKYGRTPVEWVYVAPNTQILSNSSPNKSRKFGYKVQASSGPKGCYMVAFTSCDETKGADYDGRLYCFEDYTKIPLDELKFNNKFADLKYGDLNVLSILKKRYEMTDFSKGIYMAGDVYVNVIYVDELDDIIAKGK